MRKNSNQNNAIEDYLKSIEANEHAKQRRKIVIFLALAVVTVGFLMIWWLYPASNSASKVELKIYRLENLNEQMVSMELASHPEGIIIIDDAANITDTIRSIERFQDMMMIHHAFSQRNKSIVDTVALAFKEEQIPTEETMDTEEVQPEVSTPESDPLPQQSAEAVALRTYPVDIAGERITGNELYFTIEFYNPDNIYIIDYGNGDRKRVNERHSFAYDRPGKYTVTLTAIDPVTNAQSEYIKSLDIRNQPVVAENSATTHEVNPPARKSPDTSGMVASVNDDALSGIGSTSGTQAGELTRSAENPGNVAPLPLETRVEDRIDNSLPVSESQASIPENVSLANPMEFAENMPTYPGGVNAMTQFLNKQLTYPATARDNEVEGTVYIQFVVASNGTLSNFKVVKGIGFGCDEEALRVARQMPGWVPGEHAGKKVPVIYTIPVNFTLR